MFIKQNLELKELNSPSTPFHVDIATQSSFDLRFLCLVIKTEAKNESLLSALLKQHGEPFSHKKIKDLELSIQELFRPKAQTNALESSIVLR